MSNFILSPILLVSLIVSQIGFIGCARTGSMRSTSQVMGEFIASDAESIETPVSMIIPSNLLKTFESTEAECAGYIANTEINLNQIVQTEDILSNWDQETNSCAFSTTLLLQAGIEYTIDVFVYKNITEDPKIITLQASKKFTLSGSTSNIDLFLNVLNTVNLGEGSNAVTNDSVQKTDAKLKFNDAPVIKGFSCNLITSSGNYHCSFEQYIDDNPLKSCTLKASDENGTELYNETVSYNRSGCDQLSIPHTTFNTVAYLSIVYTIEDILGAKTVFLYKHNVK